MRKFTLVFILTFLFVATLVTPASAGPKDKSDLPTEGVMSSDPMYGSSDDLNQAAATGGLIMQGSCSISNVGNGNVEMYGYTQTYSAVNSIKVTVYLQRWTGSQ